VQPFMPKDKPRYLMGVGTPSNIIEAVWRGVDLFDCVMPSRNARHGHLFTWEGIRNLNNAKYARDDAPIEPGCNCPTCRSHSRAYLHHLIKAKEMLGMRLAVAHNLYFYNTLLEQIRLALDENRLHSSGRVFPASVHKIYAAAKAVAIPGQTAIIVLLTFLEVLNLMTQLLTTAESGGSSWVVLLVQLLPIVLIMVVFYFLLIRPQKKQEKQVQKMRASLEVGDEVVTSGGIIGRVVSLREDNIVIETGSDRSKLRIARWAVAQNNTVHDAPAEEK
ncbi:MAG: preprotein translocase subunit YajC, partial [Oscillospiraceae bacterium]